MIKFFARCDICSKFGEFWGMFRLPKQQLKCRRITIKAACSNEWALAGHACQAVVPLGENKLWMLCKLNDTFLLISISIKNVCLRVRVYMLISDLREVNTFQLSWQLLNIDITDYIYCGWEYCGMIQRHIFSVLNWHLFMWLCCGKMKFLFQLSNCFYK